MKNTAKKFLSICLLLFSCICTSFSSEQKARSFTQFMSDNPSSSHVIIVGTGHTVKTYPQNYFLMDISEKGIPDLTADICANIPKEMHGKFDVVILEHLPMNCIPSGMKNVKDLLKIGGKLVFNNICSVDMNSSQQSYNHATETLMPGVKYIKLDAEATYDFAKIAFRMYVDSTLPKKPNYNTIMETCKTNVLDPFLIKHNFSKAEKPTDKYVTTIADDRLLSATKNN